MGCLLIVADNSSPLLVGVLAGLHCCHHVVFISPSHTNLLQNYSSLVEGNFVFWISKRISIKAVANGGAPDGRRRYTKINDQNRTMLKADFTKSSKVSELGIDPIILKGNFYGVIVVGLASDCFNPNIVPQKASLA